MAILISFYFYFHVLLLLLEILHKHHQLQKKRYITLPQKLAGELWRYTALSLAVCITVAWRTCFRTGRKISLFYKGPMGLCGRNRLYEAPCASGKCEYKKTRAHGHRTNIVEKCETSHCSLWVVIFHDPFFPFVPSVFYFLSFLFDAVLRLW